MLAISNGEDPATSGGKDIMIISIGDSPVSPAVQAMDRRMAKGHHSQQALLAGVNGKRAPQPVSPAGRSILEKGKSASVPCWQ